MYNKKKGNYTKKDLIALNQSCGESGELRSDSSLDYALNTLKYNKSWIFEIATLVRNIIIDHPFVDGNKRTTYLLTVIYFEDNEFEYNDEKIIRTLHRIAKNNINQINQIARLLLKCLVKKE